MLLEAVVRGLLEEERELADPLVLYVLVLLEQTQMVSVITV